MKMLGSDVQLSGSRYPLQTTLGRDDCICFQYAEIKNIAENVIETVRKHHHRPDKIPFSTRLKLINDTEEAIEMYLRFLERAKTAGEKKGTAYFDRRFCRLYDEIYRVSPVKAEVLSNGSCIKVITPLLGARLNTNYSMICDLLDIALNHAAAEHPISTGQQCRYKIMVKYYGRKDIMQCGILENRELHVVTDAICRRFFFDDSPDRADFAYCWCDESRNSRIEIVVCTEFCAREYENWFFQGIYNTDQNTTAEKNHLIQCNLNAACKQLLRRFSENELLYIGPHTVSNDQIRFHADFLWLLFRLNSFLRWPAAAVKNHYFTKGASKGKRVSQKKIDDYLCDPYKQMLELVDGRSDFSLYGELPQTIYNKEYESCAVARQQSDLMDFVYSTYHGPRCDDRIPPIMLRASRCIEKYKTIPPDGDNISLNGLDIPFEDGSLRDYITVIVSEASDSEFTVKDYWALTDDTYKYPYKIDVKALYDPNNLPKLWQYMEK